MLDYEDIFRLAPDKDSFERAKKQASARKWRDLQSNGTITWGNSKSSGATYYKTLLDTRRPGNPRFICNCPSRKKPCKHGLALAMLLHHQSGAFRITEGAPDWVAEMLLKEKTVPSTSELAEIEERRAEERLKNREKRLLQMKSGLAELDLRLADILQQGLARVEEQGEEFWDNLSARMTDAKLGGIGKRVLNLQNFDKQTDRHEKMLAELGQIHLLSKGFQKLEQLPASLKDELLNQAGINYKREEVLQTGESIPDTWLIVGQTEHTADEKLYERRTWVYGENLDRFGLFLDFAFQTEPYKENWQVGHIFQGETVFYPAAYPLRMIAKTMHRVDEPVHWIGYSNFEEFAGVYANALADNPWLSRFPALLMNTIPVRQGEGFVLVDEGKKCVQASLSENFDRKLIALSGGHPINVFGEWNGETFKILSASTEDRFVHFTLPPLKRKEPVWKQWGR